MRDKIIKIVDKIDLSFIIESIISFGKSIIETVHKLPNAEMKIGIIILDLLIFQILEYINKQFFNVERLFVI